MTFLRKLCVFAVCNAVLFGMLGLALIAKHSRTPFAVWESDSALSVTPNAQSFDVTMLGSSRARQFTRYGNHGRVEQILNKRVINLAKAPGGGTLSAKLNLENFYRRKNTTKHLVYFFDPFVLYTPLFNEHLPSLYLEPFSFWYLAEMLRHGVELGSIQDYLINNIFSDFKLAAVYDQPASLHGLQQIDAHAVSRRMEILYPEGLNQSAYTRYLAQFAEVVALAQAHQAEVHVVLLPTALGSEPGIPQALADLQRLSGEMNFALADYSNAVSDLGKFEDHDHLNTAGIVEFTETKLKPMLE